MSSSPILPTGKQEQLQLLTQPNSKRKFAKKLPREALDFYPTPAWCTKLLLKHCSPLKKHVIEPGAGDGAICKVLKDISDLGVTWTGTDYHVHAIEIQDVFADRLKQVADQVTICDFLNWTPPERQMIQTGGLQFVGNPPFCLALEFLEHIFQFDPIYVAFLLRLDFLGSKRRAAFHNSHPLTQLAVLGKRPGFTIDGKTDLYNYAWFLWIKNAPPRSPIVLLP